MSKLLFDEQPLIVSRELAKLIGLNEAIVLQQIHYWLEINRKANKNFHDGRYWTYNTMKNWHENDFSFWSHNTVQRTFTSLVNRGYLILGNYNRKSFDQTKWYSIDYKALETLNLPITPKWGNALPQNAPMHYPILGYTIPENNTYTTVHKNIQSNPILSVWELPEEKIKTDEIGCDEKAAQNDEPEKRQKKESFINANASQSIKRVEKPSPKYDYNTVLEIIKDNIEYDYILMERSVDENLLDEICHVIASTICSDFKDGYISMGDERVYAETVRSVFFKLDKEEIENYAENFLRQTTPITKTSAYIRTALYRNHRTGNHHITNRVNVDMPYMAEPKVGSKRV